MENKDTIAENRIAKYLVGEASPMEEEQLQKWRAESSENEAFFQDFKKTLELGQQHYQVDTAKSLGIDIDAEWNQFLKNISVKEGTKVVSLEKQVETSNVWLKIAASLILIIGVGFAINYFSGQPSLVHYQTAQNTQEVTLPDGSIITLNKQSFLSYLEDFGKVDRQVSLSGEAFFDVAKDKTKQFIITTENAQVQVLGTSFNVRAYDQSEATEVVVATGIVKLSKQNSNEAITLNAGDKGMFESNKLYSETNKDTNFLSWKTGKIMFEEESLEAVIEALNRIYQVDISTEEDASCEVTVTFEQQTIEAVLNVLKITLDLQYTVKGDEINITSIGC